MVLQVASKRLFITGDPTELLHGNGTGRPKRLTFSVITLGGEKHRDVCVEVSDLHQDGEFGDPSWFLRGTTPGPYGGYRFVEGRYDPNARSYKGFLELGVVVLL